jgi:hypothetical protein
MPANPAITLPIFLGTPMPGNPTATPPMSLETLTCRSRAFQVPGFLDGWVPRSLDPLKSRLQRSWEPGNPGSITAWTVNHLGCWQPCRIDRLDTMIPGPPVFLPCPGTKVACRIVFLDAWVPGSLVASRSKFPQDPGSQVAQGSRSPCRQCLNVLLGTCFFVPSTRLVPGSAWVIRQPGFPGSMSSGLPGILEIEPLEPGRPPWSLGPLIDLAPRSSGRRRRLGSWALMVPRWTGHPGLQGIDETWKVGPQVSTRGISQ